MILLELCLGWNSRFISYFRLFWEMLLEFRLGFYGGSTEWWVFYYGCVDSMCLIRKSFRLLVVGLYGWPNWDHDSVKGSVFELVIWKG
jgi:hypothetical protein